MTKRIFSTAYAITSATLVCGCAGLSNYQAACEAKTSTFPEFAECYKADVSADRRAGSDARVKFLLLKTDQLAEQVKSGRISDLDARVEFQQHYVRIRESAKAEAAANRSSTTSCVANGNKVNCTSY